MGKSSHVAYSVITYITHYFVHHNVFLIYGRMENITIIFHEYVVKTCFCIRCHLNIACCVTSSKGFEISINKLPKNLVILNGQ